MVKFNPDSFQNKIYGLVDSVYQTTINKRINAISSVVNKQQNTFFPSLAKLIIRSTRSPSLSGYGTDWVPLTEKYITRREKATRGQVTGMMYYRGITKSGDPTSLAQVLPRMRATDKFGTPTINVWREGTSGRAKVKVTGNYASLVSSGKRVALSKVKNLVTRLSIDLFPNIKEDVSTGSIGGMLGGYLQDELTTYKLTNTHGEERREIITPYIRWWINVRMKQLIRARI